MKKREKELLSILLRNSKLSDREIAKKLKTSQSTITRTRHKLERSGIIKSYVTIPNFKKVGVQVMAVTFGKANASAENILKKVHAFMQKHPNIMFAATGEGMGMTGAMVSLHTDFSRYTDFIREFRASLDGDIMDLQSFIIPVDRIDRLNFGEAVSYIAKKNES